LPKKRITGSNIVSQVGLEEATSNLDDDLNKSVPFYTVPFYTCRDEMPIKQTQGNLEQWLPIFFNSYQACRAPRGAVKPPPHRFGTDCENLAHWFEVMAQPLLDARQGAFHCDPWEVASLGKDEFRNTAVLAWLLNPIGSHGLGDAALKPLLEQLDPHFGGGFSLSPNDFCHVRVEANPDGGISNRVDIEISNKSFYLIIEVKIGAQEGMDQLRRYGDLAKIQAGDRPWAILFLTPDGRDAKTAGGYLKKTYSMSWKNLSQIIAKSLRARSQTGPKGPRRQMVEQIVHLFLKKIRCF